MAYQMDARAGQKPPRRPPMNPGSRSSSVASSTAANHRSPVAAAAGTCIVKGGSGPPYSRSRTGSEPPSGGSRRPSVAGQNADSISAQRAEAQRGPQPLSREVVLAATTLQRASRESIDQYLNRITHLQLQGQKLGPNFGPGLQPVPSLTVMYAYDNLFTSLDGVQVSKRLQLLYLQNNRLTSLKGLEHLTHLRVLHLGHNRLSKIDHLDNCKQLEELHVSHQRFVSSDLPVSGCLDFCPRTVHAIAPSLRVFRAAGCNLRSTESLAPLQNLQQLDLSENSLQQVKDLRHLLTGRFLAKIFLTGNPLAVHERKHRSMIVLMAPAVEEIDGRAVLPQERDFVQRLEEQKRRFHAQRQQSLVGDLMMQNIAPTLLQEPILSPTKYSSAASPSRDVSLSPKKSAASPLAADGRGSVVDHSTSPVLQDLLAN